MAAHPHPKISGGAAHLLVDPAVSRRKDKGRREERGPFFEPGAEPEKTPSHLYDEASGFPVRDVQALEFPFLRLNRHVFNACRELSHPI